MSDPCLWWEFWTKDPQSVRDFALILSGVAAVGLGYWRTKAANRSSWAADQQAKTGVQSHITENFTKAVEQLGSDKLDVRLGAIYALARIAQDSERDYWPIMQTLTAYVRERRTRLPDTQSSETKESPIVDARGAPFSVQSDTRGKSETIPAKIPVDIQSVLAVLGSRKHEYEKHHQNLDLSNTDLRRLVLERGENHLGCINLMRADLCGAVLLFADLSGANLMGANLTGAYLSGANLTGANLMMTDLCRADLMMTDLCGADLRITKNLTCEQLRSANDWKSAYRDKALACGADIPQALK